MRAYVPVFPVNPCAIASGNHREIGGYSIRAPRPPPLAQRPLQDFPGRIARKFIQHHSRAQPLKLGINARMLQVTAATGVSPHFLSGTPNTATSVTRGWRMTTSSMSRG